MSALPRIYTTLPPLRLVESPQDPGDLDRLYARIASLESELDLLRQRDRVLSGYMLKLDEEQRLAARIQQDFLPKSMPEVGSTRFHAIFRPAGYVSGDLYDVTRIDESHVGIYVADAVGHGMPAALLTMFMRNALVTKQITPDGYRLLEPGETLARLNESLRSPQLASSSFATALYARVNCLTGEVRFARGGHPGPVVIKRDGTLIELDADGGLLGVFDDAQWEVVAHTLEPGDRLLIYTDGIEVLYRDHKLSPDQTRWKRELASRTDLPTPELLDYFRQMVDDRAAEQMTRDDLTMVVIERDGK
jgi:sigma-B regulation protein RsbU (phosphoserine phosphatase)